MPELREGGDSGTPIVVSQPDSPAGEALIQAARALALQSRTLVRRPLGLTVSSAAAAAAGGNGHAHPDHRH